jgi:hypothetical protein
MLNNHDRAAARIWAILAALGDTDSFFGGSLGCFPCVAMLPSRTPVFLAVQASGGRAGDHEAERS